MDDDPRAKLQDALQRAADGPFGEAEMAPTRALASCSRASLDRAQNLLTKAAKALAEGNTALARGLVDRAVGLDYDSHEESHPAALAVGLMLFCEVVD